MFEEEPFSLNPVYFFAISCDCYYLTKQDQFPSLVTNALPSTQSLTQEENFAKIAMGWNEEGISILLQVNQSEIQSFYPSIENGDSIELFFDTRDLKTTGFNTRFCHHFFFLPQMVEEVDRGERTHFRTDDSHPLCDPRLLYCETQKRKKGYHMKIFIPSQCLYGYDPNQFDRLGFSYRINRFNGEPQHFAVISKDYQIDQQPSLWGTLKLVK